MDAITSNSNDINNSALILQPHPDKIKIDPYEELEKIFREVKKEDDGDYKKYFFHQNQALLLLRLEPRAAVRFFSRYTPLTHFVRAKAELPVIQEVAHMFKANISEYQGTDVMAREGEFRNALHEVSRVGGWEEGVAKYLYREFPEMLLDQETELPAESLLGSPALALAEKLRLLDLMFELQPCLLKDSKTNTRLFAAALENQFGSFIKTVLFSRLAQAKPTSFFLFSAEKEMDPEHISCRVPILPHLESFDGTYVEWTKAGYIYLMNSLHLMGSKMQSLKIPYLPDFVATDENTGQPLFDTFMENNSSLKSLTLLLLPNPSDEIVDTFLLERAYRDICRIVKNHPTINTLQLSCKRRLPMSGKVLAGFLMNTQHIHEITFRHFELSSEDWPTTDDSQLISANQRTKINIDVCTFTPEILKHLLDCLQSPKLKHFCVQGSECSSPEVHGSTDPKIDATAALCSLLNEGSLEEFEFRAERLCHVDMEVLVESLATNTSLTGFHLEIAADMDTARAGVFAIRKLLSEKNKTLTRAEIIVHDHDNDEGEKSYAVCACTDPRDAISYHLELNRYGRGLVHAKETTKEKLADLLGSIEEEDPGRNNSKHAIQFGLLLERPCLWS